MARGRGGYTFVELLVVIAILAVLFAAGMDTYRKARWRAAVREGLSTLASTLREARSTAQRFNVTTRVRFTSKRGFELEAKDRAGNVHRSYARALPSSLLLDYTRDGSTWRPVTALGEVVYSAPYGETGASSTLFRVRHARSPRVAACLRIVGVTGKVVVARACP